MSGSVSDETLALLGDVEERLAETSHLDELLSIRERLSGPLRIAIAGRVKAGKSTLLNALVGVRLAPTDAGECTKIVSWYRNGPLYQVHAEMRDGSRQQLRFTRHEGSLDIDLGGLPEDTISHLDIQWPTSNLQRITLIDTPGLESLNDENSRRTRDLLETEDGQSSDVDAVIYLMRHLHTTDVAFLDAYMDRSVPESSPVNAIAVLSRADEVGAGRLDAMESAERIAARYRTNDQVRSLASTVIPLAGLLAETGLTLREDEATALASIARLPQEDREALLLSAKHFVDVSRSDLTAEIRADLLGRLGLFGVRLAIREIMNGANTASTLAPRLMEASGIHRLNQIIEEQFLPRARVLQARTALVSLRALAARLDPGHHAVVEHIEREVERIEATAIEFVRMRAAHLVLSGGVHLRPADTALLEQLFLAAPEAGALGLAVDATDSEIMAAAGETIGRWRGRANDPLAGATGAEVFEAAARTAETIYMRAQQRSS